MIWVITLTQRAGRAHNPKLQAIAALDGNIEKAMAKLEEALTISDYFCDPDSDSNQSYPAQRSSAHEHSPGQPRLL